MTTTYEPGYLDIVVYIARKYHGARDDWRWRFRKRSGILWTYQGSSFKDTRADGSYVWHDPELNPLEFSVTLGQYMVARADYERDTGKCGHCHGNGTWDCWAPASVCYVCGGSGLESGHAQRELEKFQLGQGANSGCSNG